MAVVVARQVFARPVKHHNGVVHGKAEDGEKRSHEQNINFNARKFSEHREYAGRDGHIMHERHNGADAVLLIVALLPAAKLKKFIKTAASLFMDALVEVHSEKEISVAIKAGAKIIGINNRNLKTFKIDMGRTRRLAKKIPKNILIVSESGLDLNDDLKNLDKRVNAVLMGTAIMQSSNISKKIHEIIKAISAK